MRGSTVGVWLPRILGGFLLVTFLGAPALAELAESETGLYFVRIPEASLATYQGTVPGLQATHPATRGDNRLDSRSPASRAYLSYLDGRLDHHADRLEQVLGHAPEVVFRHRAVSPALIVRMSHSEALEVAKLSDLVVFPDYWVHQHTDVGPTWIGAGSIWDGSATGGAPGTQGEGMVIGIIDGGTNYSHPSFFETAGDGFTHTNPFPGFLGWCDPLDPNFDPALPCNGKLVGLWDYADAAFGEGDGPDDDNGHGTHVGSTAGGNVLLSPAISGVAPRANIVGYDIAAGGSGSGATICSASDQGILDGVDVLNNSFSMGGGSPWAVSATDRCFLDAVAAGIVVTVSAGNAGPGASTVDHSGPWVVTVGSATHDRLGVQNEVSDMSGGSGAPADITGESRTTTPHGPAPIVYAGDYVNGDPDPEQCLNPFPPGTWTNGEIVVCDRGAIARVMKGQNVLMGGAGGYILANVAGSGDAVADAHVLPGSHVNLGDADALRTWLATEGGAHTATLTGATLLRDPALGDIMSGFSSRGPVNPALSNDVIKPDVANPGDAVYAAYFNGSLDEPPLVFEGEEYAILGGTSMAAPHTAGSAALVRAIRPSWTASEVKSALMLTAKIDGVLDTGGATPADPFDRGAGRVDLTVAALSGLVMDETFANYLAADPAMGGDPKTLNQASYQNSDCNGGCSFDRTFRSTATVEGVSTTWQIVSDTTQGVHVQAFPGKFTLGPGETQTVRFQVDFDDTVPQGTFLFGCYPVLIPDNAVEGITNPTLAMPVAIAFSGTPTVLFTDGFESGDTTAWGNTNP